MSGNRKKTRILILGDWFVDDHWVAGAYRSKTSSRTGKKHLASLQDIKSATESLCGAGRTASVLVRAGFAVSGVGICAKADERVLLSLLEPPETQHRNPHTLRRWTEATPHESIDFTNVGGEESGTSRAIRIYERVRENVILTQRFDWETPFPQRPNLEPLTGLLREQVKEIEAVVIKDLGKGLVCEEVLQLLRRDLAGVPWFVSTKTFLPPWKSILKEVNLRFLLVPEMAASGAIGKPIKDTKGRARQLTSWMARQTEPSKGAITLFKENLLPLLPPEGRSSSSAAVIVVANDETLLALDQGGDAYVYHHVHEGSKVPMPLSSVLLGALVGRALEYPEKRLTDLLGGAADFAYTWRRNEQRRVTHYRSWSPADEPMDELGLEIDGNARTAGFRWEEKHKEWKSAFTALTLGLVGDKTAPRLELWRSMTELPGYICIARRKRRAVSSLVHMLKHFEGSDRRRQASALLLAAPGSGKSHLVSCLARLGDFEVLHFDLSQLYRHQELVDCFDRISTTQAQLGDTPLILFFDELDSEIASGPVYRSFLAPLEGGVYVRAEKLFHIRPAVWVFAATDFNEDDPKANDFKSRLTNGVMRLTVSEKDSGKDFVGLERVYLGVSMLKLAFEEIESVKEDVLDLFYRLPKDFSNRAMGKLTQAFLNVRQRQVTAENIPWDWIGTNVQSFDGQKDEWQNSWRQRKGGCRDVRIFERPGGEGLDS